MAAMTIRTASPSANSAKPWDTPFGRITCMPVQPTCIWKLVTLNCGRRWKQSGKTSPNKKMYITGGCGALYDGASPDGSTDQQAISRVHQAYGRNYQLPNITAHNETCAAIGNVLWNWRMFLATGDARYVDVMELALYNAVLSGISLEGTDYFYVNPLRHVEPTADAASLVSQARSVRNLVLLPSKRAAHDCRGERLRLQQDGRCDMDQLVRQQRFIDGAQRRAAEADARDELSLGRARAD